MSVDMRFTESDEYLRLLGGLRMGGAMLLGTRRVCRTARTDAWAAHKEVASCCVGHHSSAGPTETGAVVIKGQSEGGAMLLHELEDPVGGTPYRSFYARFQCPNVHARLPHGAACAWAT